MVRGAGPVAAGIATLGFALTYATYAPGLMPPDAVGQFAQALSGRFTDTHPPIMAWLWAKTNAVVPGPEGFFLVLIFPYWAGFALLIRNSSRLSTPRGVIAALLPFSPILFNFAGTIWKDVLVFGCFLVASGLILSSPISARRLSPIRSFAVLLLLLLGSLARWNSVLAAIPLVVLMLWPRAPERAPLARTLTRLALCAPIVLAVWAASARAIDTNVIHAEKTGFANMLPLWDLIGMGQRLHANLLPGSWTRHESDKILTSCYNPIADNNLGMVTSGCAFIHERLRQNGYWRLGTLFPLWVKAILRHPSVYLAVRLHYLRTLFWPNAIFLFDAGSGATTFQHHTNIPFRLERRIMTICRTTPGLALVFTVGFWMLAAVILTLLFALAMARGASGSYPSLLLSLSGGLSIWPLVVIGPDGQFRFAYWAIAALCTALLIAHPAPNPAQEGALPAL